VRLRRAGSTRFAFNYGTTPTRLPLQPKNGFVIGSAELPAAGIAVWREVR
jgi:hypothetical protein